MAKSFGQMASSALKNIRESVAKPVASEAKIVKDEVAKSFELGQAQSQQNPQNNPQASVPAPKPQSPVQKTPEERNRMYTLKMFLNRYKEDYARQQQLNQAGKQEEVEKKKEEDEKRKVLQFEKQKKDESLQQAGDVEHKKRQTEQGRKRG